MTPLDDEHSGATARSTSGRTYRSGSVRLHVHTNVHVQRVPTGQAKPPMEQLVRAGTQQRERASRSPSAILAVFIMTAPLFFGLSVWRWSTDRSAENVALLGAMTAFVFGVYRAAWRRRRTEVA